MDILELRIKNDLAESDSWKEIKKFMTEKIISLSNSSMDPLEIKGLLKFIANVDSWINDYSKEIKRLKEDQ